MKRASANAELVKNFIDRMTLIAGLNARLIPVMVLSDCCASAGNPDPLPIKSNSQIDFFILASPMA
jgi:hypothetical protein